MGAYFYGPQLKEKLTSVSQDQASKRESLDEADAKKNEDQESVSGVNKPSKNVQVELSEPLVIKTKEAEQVSVQAEPAAPKPAAPEPAAYKALNAELDIVISEGQSKPSGKKVSAKTVSHTKIPLSVLQRDTIYNFSKKYCFRCHDDKKQKGDFNFNQVDFGFSTHDSIYHWQDILDVLNTAEMPPEDVKQPNEKDLSNVIGQITDRLQVGRNKFAATGGIITMRHLNRREYSGSIQNLFNADLNTEMLPTDIPEGLDTMGKEQFFTSNHYFMYYNTGAEVAKYAIKGLERKYRYDKVQRVDPEVLNNGLANRVKDKGVNIEDYHGMTHAEIKKKTMEIFPGKTGRITVPRDIYYLLDDNHKYGATGRVLFHSRVTPGYRDRINI